ncbi:3-phosphoshikimate 1-carboxyvinyltransferase [Caldimicrobium thiodismutans]|uniref:3-phosphoshikimate 1-carboxyvinyltransferase n=1 Tax=Caldimicrobium thiodismutans TaxID=1653476 RepID=A0A0U5B7D8_9BACT|nr:3-phosphoshikimate 1-carboxyvinyltransferase [Caldimicrobium thiodismutans]BAU23984.1 3-phosphoshikimate 1-carboxyvinyltransferase [Caldimicrobium thiodismutans]
MEIKKILPLKKFYRHSLKLPSSKSLTQRALICSALARGSSFIKNPLLSEDPLLLKSALEATGVIFEGKEEGFEVKGVEGFPRLNKSKLYLGNNGTGARFFLAYSALGKGDWIDLYGKERLHERPMSPLISALRSLSAKIDCLEQEGHFPVRVYEGNLRSERVSLPGYVSSQFISALLLIGPYLPLGLEIAIEGELFSKSYVDMTLEVMERFGVKVEVKSNLFYIPQGSFKASIYEVPADASSASYFLAIPLILGKGSIIIENFDYYTKQADSVFLELIKDFGGMVRPIDPIGVEVFFEGRPKAGSFNLRDCPDLFPTMAILGAVAEGRTVLYGAPHLRYKETDRIKAVATELSKIGVKVEELPDGLIIYGGDNFNPARIETYDDHRIAMAFAILALKAGPLEIENPDCVAKSFPNFWELFEQLYAEDPSDRL